MTDLSHVIPLLYEPGMIRIGDCYVTSGNAWAMDTPQWVEGPPMPSILNFGPLAGSLPNTPEYIKASHHSPPKGTP